MYESTIRMADLLLEISVLRKKIAALESGEKYQQLQEQHRRELAAKDREIKHLKNELAEAHAETVDVRNKWIQTCDDVTKEKDRVLASKDRELKRMEARMYNAERKRDEAKDKVRDIRLELYKAQTEIEEKEKLIQKLTVQINRDYTNSSNPSSMKPNHKTIHNSRENSGRKPGAQPGHPHHGRKRLTPSKTIQISPPKEFLDTTKYRPTGKMIVRQVQELQISVTATDYETPEFVCLKTGKKVHADFPAGVKDDVNYNEWIKAFAYCLNNKCNVSIQNTQEFLKEISNGQLNISAGMICNLSREFSKKTEKERSEIFYSLLTSPVMHTDFTFDRVNGKTGTVMICLADGLVLYQGREAKGYEGIKGSPVEIYQNIVVSDHESVFVSRGTKHQECLAHVERYLRSSMENEPELTWNKKMLEWVKEAIHYRNEVLRAGETLDEEKVTYLKNKFDEILSIGNGEYEYVPPKDSFREGYNLCKRMTESPQEYLLFLDNILVPPTNNAAERAGRKVKRKAKAVMCFRSTAGHEYYLDGLSVMETMEAKGEDMIKGIAARFAGHQKAD